MYRAVKVAWRYVLGLVEALWPSFLSKDPHFNFITVHYFWILGLSTLGSILIWAMGRGNNQLTFIDALFFACGANTQAGLNPIDVNNLNTAQQVTIMFLSMTSGPITINSAVVFLRLYWFERKFREVTRKAMARRATMSKSKAGGNQDMSDMEAGVNGRNITVMHDTAKSHRITNDGTVLDEYTLNGAAKTDPDSSNGVESDEASPSPRDPRIRFTDQVRYGIKDESEPALPRQRTEAEHIAILERQRKEDQHVLRIPGPRDAERGVLPEELAGHNGGRGDALGSDDRSRRDSEFSRCWSPSPTRRAGTADGNADGHAEGNADGQKNITIEEPDHPNRGGPRDVEGAQSTSNPDGRRTQGRRGSRSDLQARLNPLRRIKTAMAPNNNSDPMPYLSWQPTIGRNSEFLDLTEEQREELGGIEYRSLKTLAVVMTFYFWGFWIFGIVCLLPWLLHSEQYAQIVDAAGQSRAWWGIWSANSAFTDLGFTLTPDSMISFKDAVWPLLVMSFLIIIGNTGFPVMLRFMIWLAQLFATTGSGLWEELRFLLDHPRRCFTLLFPSAATWWLFGILMAFNGIDLILFILVDLKTDTVSDLPLHVRFLDGWFQAASTRTAGFQVVNLAAIHPAVQTSYLIMMYISVFPIAISVRRTNVYEEKALGLYGSANEGEEVDENKVSYVGAHLRRQLSFDLWFIFIGYFILTLTEGAPLMSNDLSMFAVLFEVVSAYGTVGLSLGYPGVNASLSSQFSVGGKLVIIAMMIRGRHRGLPYGLDRAILLPGESLHRTEAQDAEVKMMQRRQSAVSLAPTASGIGVRGRSVDHRNVLTQFLHPGPSYANPMHSVAEADVATGSFVMHRSETMRRSHHGPPDDDETRTSPSGPRGSERLSLSIPP